jgi:hypothetical protein
MVHASCLDEDTLVYMYGILGIACLGTQVGMIDRLSVSLPAGCALWRVWLAAGRTLL